MRLLADYTRTTPEAMQALARKYLGPGRSWRAAVLPQGPASAVAATESEAMAAAAAMQSERQTEGR